jgi:hypothetical protein
MKFSDHLNKNIRPSNQVPDFGFTDELIYELRNTKITSNLHKESDTGEDQSIWGLLYNYISGNQDYERFNNIMNSFRDEKNTVIT